MAKDDITKTRKKLTKLIRKFNKGQVEYVAVGKHADNKPSTEQPSTKPSTDNKPSTEQPRTGIQR